MQVMELSLSFFICRPRAGPARPAENRNFVWSPICINTIASINNVLYLHEITRGCCCCRRRIYNRYNKSREWTSLPHTYILQRSLRAFSKKTKNKKKHPTRVHKSRSPFPSKTRQVDYHRGSSSVDLLTSFSFVKRMLLGAYTRIKNIQPRREHRYAYPRTRMRAS